MSNKRMMNITKAKTKIGSGMIFNPVRIPINVMTTVHIISRAILRKKYTNLNFNESDIYVSFHNLS